MLQDKLAELIHRIYNVEVLNAIHILLVSSIEKEKYVTKEQLLQRALISEEDIKSGRVSTFEDVLEESKDW